jgi:vacuolar-type H+-ATPase subunit E/Vma4
MEETNLFKAYNEFFSNVYDKIREIESCRLYKAYLQSLLDVAYQTGDKEWFMVLTNRLNCLTAWGGNYIEY